MEGVVKVGPVPRDTPPVGVAYQLIAPSEAVAPRVTVPAPHLEAGVALVMVGTTFTMAWTEDLVEVQLPLVTSTQ